MKRFSLFLFALIGALILAVLPSAEAQKKKGGIPKEYRESVDKALKWLAEAQEPDGHWGSDKGANQKYKGAMTGLAGVALLMEGSTAKQGKYSKHILKAVDWFIARAQRDNANSKEGLITDTDDPEEKVRYMYGHGYATLFLACAFGDVDGKYTGPGAYNGVNRPQAIKEILTKAVKYIGNAQSSIKNGEAGGWYYTSKQEGGNNDEGSVTITQVQALRACKNVAIDVPNEIVKKAQKYLEMSTTQGGGVLYRCPQFGGAPAFGGERPALTAAAISCGFSFGDYNSEIVKKWFKYCKDKIGYGTLATGHDDYTQYYYAQAVYILGDDGWEKLFGPTPADQRLTWTAYQEKMFKFLKDNQSPDGSWNPRGGWGVGRVFATSINVSIMQLDKATLPIFTR